MHGRLKIRTSAEEAARKKKEQELKVKAYRFGMSKILKKRQSQELDEEMLVITGQILQKNPDVYTLWNIRKECLLLISKDSNDFNLFVKDLNFTEQCLMVNPKSYGAWHHRCWILTNCPEPDWEKEVMLCTKYLKLDERNFHCWDYRRFVVEKAKVTEEQEFEFCSEKIRKNFSNYSSWHYRSKLLPILHPHDSGSNRPISEDKLKEELELVLAAAFTDPNDSSAWFYQRWLLGYSKPQLDIAAFRITPKKLVISFTQAVDIQKFTIFFGTLELKKSNFKPVQIGYLYDNTWVMNEHFDLHSESNFTVKCLHEDGKTLEIGLMECQDGFYGFKCPKFEYEFGSGVIDELKTQLSSCEQLLEYEPDSKWTILTASLLMRAIDRKLYHEKSIQYMKKLETIDKMRMGYYEDLCSKWNIEKTLEEWINACDISKEVDLSELELTSLPYEQGFSIADKINLSRNRLADRSIKKINAFQFAKSLNLSSNLFTKNVELESLNMLEILLQEK